MAEQKDLDLVSKLTPEELAEKRFSLRCLSPDDGKYWGTTKKLSPYISAQAEWIAAVYVQRVLLETRVEFGLADKKHLDELDSAIPKIDPLNISLLEDKVTKHDQLAVLEEIGRHVSPETKALLHPGTTSYDILDTVRSYLFKKAWYELIRPEVCKAVEQLCTLAEGTMGVLQVGRTHLQKTSPVPFGATLALYAARLAERVEKCDYAFNDLRGKISGIVGTGASVEMVIGEGKALKFEERVLEKLGLKPDYTATQIVQKEKLVDAGNGVLTLMLVLKDFANDMRLLYSADINEITSRDSKERLGGSSADAAKNNPINYENIRGKAKVAEAAMTVLHDLPVSDLQRDLSGSVEARYEPQGLMAKLYESFCRVNRELPQLSVNLDKMSANLQPVRENPSEAMTAILRGQPEWVHPEYGVGHDFVKKMSKKAQQEKKPLLEVCLMDEYFSELFGKLPMEKQRILLGELELYTGAAKEKAAYNIAYARKVAGLQPNH